jgi:hypothetical protein
VLDGVVGRDPDPEVRLLREETVLHLPAVEGERNTPAVASVGPVGRS